MRGNFIIDGFVALLQEHVPPHALPMSLTSEDLLALLVCGVDRQEGYLSLNVMPEGLQVSKSENDFS